MTVGEGGCQIQGLVLNLGPAHRKAALGLKCACVAFVPVSSEAAGAVGSSPWSQVSVCKKAYPGDAFLLGWGEEVQFLSHLGLNHSRFHSSLLLVHTLTLTHIHTCTHTQIHTHMCTLTDMCTAHTHMHVHTCTNRHTLTCAHSHTCALNTHVHTCTHIHSHVHTHSALLASRERL